MDDWLRRQLSDAQCADAVADAIKVAKVNATGPLGSDDFLVSKICIILDPTGPIHYKGISFMPDGFGSTMAVEMLRRLLFVALLIPFSVGMPLTFGLRPGAGASAFALRGTGFSAPGTSLNLPSSGLGLPPGLV